MAYAKPTKLMIRKKLTGELTFPVLAQVLKKFYKETPPRYVLWDLSQGSLANLTNQEMDTLVGFLKEEGKIRQDGKAAVVACRDVDFGLVRMMLLSGADFPFEIQVFRSIAEAEKWLGEAK